MGIIAVSRELAALGDETGRELAKLLGYRLVDKHTLEERIKSFGIESQKFKKYDECKPSFLASFSQDRDDYLHYLKAAIFAEAEQSNCVFIGRGAGVVFKNMPALFSLFLASTLDIRIERVKAISSVTSGGRGKLLRPAIETALVFTAIFLTLTGGIRQIIISPSTQEFSILRTAPKLSISSKTGFLPPKRKCKTPSA